MVGEAVCWPAITITHQHNSIINESLTKGEFPNYFNNIIVEPLLKKPSLDKDELKNYRPVSNLHFISKVIENLVAKRLD